MADDATPTAIKSDRSGSRAFLGDQQQTRVRAALARLGGTHKTSHPELEPLFRIVRSTHPKADLKLIERAYEMAEFHHRGQLRRSGDPYITHPLAVAQILAELGMTAPTLCAALLHDTIEDTDYDLETLRQDFGDEIARTGRRRDQARQGEVRPGRAGREHPQDGCRDGP